MHRRTLWLASWVEANISTIATTYMLVAGSWFVLIAIGLIEHASASQTVLGIGLVVFSIAMLVRTRWRYLRVSIAGANDETGPAPSPKENGIADEPASRALRGLSSFRQPSRALHEVLGVIGHELRTPLAGVRAITEFIISEPDRNTAQITNFLRSIHDEIGRCSEMVNNMLEAARLDSGLARWSWQPVNLAKVCRAALDIVQPLARSKRLRFNCAVARSCEIRGDADALRRLILNLLSNSVRHTVEGEIRIEVREARGPDHNWVQIDVRDTGTGIPPELAQFLGRAFAANVGVVRSHDLKGAGLGLAICREIACAHGGRISVESRPGRGTTFTVLLRADLEGPVTGERTEEPIPLTTAA